MSTANPAGFGRIVPFALVTLVLLWLAHTGAFGGAALAIAFAALAFAALALAMHRGHPAGVRTGLLVGLFLSAALIALLLMMVTEALRRGNGVAIAAAVLIALLASLPIAMTVASASALRRLPSSPPAWLAALAFLTAAMVLFFTLLKVGAELEAPDALGGIAVHNLRFSPDSRELTVASEFTSSENIFSIPEGRFIRSERGVGIRNYLGEPRSFRTSDGSMALEIGFGERSRKVDALSVRDAAGKVLWTHPLGLRDQLARGNGCCLVGTAAFSPDNRYLAIAYFSTVYLYDARSGTGVAIMAGPTQQPKGRPWWQEMLRHVV